MKRVSEFQGFMKMLWFPKAPVRSELRFLKNSWWRLIPGALKEVPVVPEEVSRFRKGGFEEVTLVLRSLDGFKEPHKTVFKDILE